MKKLVRDRIPEIIRAKGQEVDCYVAEESEYVASLREKLQEEMQEFLDSEEVEELADILEVMYAIIDQKGVSREELEKIRVKKAEERGGFKDKIICKFD